MRVLEHIRGLKGHESIAQALAGVTFSIGNRRFTWVTAELNY